MEKKKVIFDMELNDPDDYFALIFLARHPLIDLTGVTVYPGNKSQIGCIKTILKNMNKNIPVGSDFLDVEYSLNPIHHSFVSFLPAEPDMSAIELLKQNIESGSILFTGAPLTNIKNLLKTYQNFSIPLLFGQGGFVGCNVAPVIYRSFKKKVTNRTFNFCSDIEAVDLILKTKGKKFFTSKNVTHHCKYTKETHQKLKKFNHSLGLFLIYKGMDTYLQQTKAKKFHDVLAAMTIISDSVVEFKEVEMYHQINQKGFVEWGSKAKKGTNIFASINYSKEIFFQLLTEII